MVQIKQTSNYTVLLLPEGKKQKQLYLDMNMNIIIKPFLISKNK